DVASRGGPLRTSNLQPLSSRIALLAPRIAVRVIPVALPEAQALLIEQQEATHPLHALPSIKMRHDQTQRPAMLGRERRAVVLESEENVGPLEVGEGDICRVAFFGQQQRELRPGLGFDELQNVRKEHAPPMIVEAAPARHAVKIGNHLGLRQGAKFFPREPQGLFDFAGNLKIPRRWIEDRDAAVVQNGPLQRERLTRWQAAFPPRSVPRLLAG